MVGAGLIGRRHIELIKQSSECRLAAVVDPNHAAREAFREDRLPLFDTLDGLFAAERPDGVVLATPSQLHVAQGLACVEAGVPALIEKPVAVTVEDGQRLREAAEAANAKLLVGHHRQHSPIMAKAQEVVESGILGRLVAVTGSAMFYKPDEYFEEGPWRRELGGGPILINMIHEVGNLRALMGEITAVQAFSSNDTRGFPVEDTVAINLRFASGALGTFLLSDTAASAQSWEQTAGENASYASYEDVDCYSLAGTDGSLAIPTMRLKTHRKKADRSWWKPLETGNLALERADPLERQLRHFCAVIRGETDPVVTVHDGLRNLAIIVAIDRAARTGEVVLTA